jgi:large subunit ribosomal protein L5
MKYVPRLKTKYQNEVVPALMKQFNYSSLMQVPRIEKICINQGIGDATGDKKLVDNAATELSTIVGQKAVSTKAKKSVSNFKLREGMPIGVRVTLRGERMYEFLDRFLNIEKVSKIMGMDISFVTTANTDAEAYALLKELGMPFYKK